MKIGIAVPNENTCHSSSGKSIKKGAPKFIVLRSLQEFQEYAAGHFIDKETVVAVSNIVKFLEWNTHYNKAVCEFRKTFKVRDGMDFNAYHKISNKLTPKVKGFFQLLKQNFVMPSAVLSNVEALFYTDTLLLSSAVQADIELRGYSTHVSINIYSSNVKGHTITQFVEDRLNMIESLLKDLPKIHYPPLEPEYEDLIRMRQEGNTFSKIGTTLSKKYPDWKPSRDDTSMSSLYGRMMRRANSIFRPK